MTRFSVELVGGPAAQKGTIDVPSDDPPDELPIKIAEGPPIRTEELGPKPGVLTYAIYVFHQIAEDGTAVYAYSHERGVQ